MVDTVTRERRSEIMANIRSKDMKPEVIVRSAAHRLGYRFRLHRRDLPGKPDLTFSRHRKVIFVHGCFWHWHDDPKCKIARLPQSNRDYWIPKLERTRARDQEHIRQLHDLGWKVLVLWECQLDEEAELRARLRAFLGPYSKVV